MDVVEIGWRSVDWIDLAQDMLRQGNLVNALMNLRVPYNAGKLPSSCTTGDLSSGAQLHRVSSLVRDIEFDKTCEREVLKLCDAVPS
jgi:hypothetical protein